MGVLGLTTYLHEHRRAVSQTLQFPAVAPSPRTAVVDGWAFIYQLYEDAGLPWVYGGEYGRFHSLVKDVVRGWIGVGLTLHFVFDGPSPPSKFQAIISRTGQSRIQPSLLFFRTSPASREKHRFLNETHILPPLVLDACVHALQDMQRDTDMLMIHFADSECDPFAVELAGRVGAYVVGNDSDYVILNAEGYLGFMSLDEMVWSSTQSPEDSVNEGPQDGFQVARKSKRVAKHSNTRGIIPPFTKDIALTATVYSPLLLAMTLETPVSLLPLISALVGNDHSRKGNTASLFFERHLTLSQRIAKVATTIRNLLALTSKKSGSKDQVESVIDLIDKSVRSLLGRFVSNIGSGELKNIVDNVVEATLQYTIPKSGGFHGSSTQPLTSDICVLHEADACPLFNTLSGVHAENNGFSSQSRLDIAKLYLSAYRKGRLSPKILDVVHSATFWPRFFLENPDLETVSRSIGRPIRQWYYALLQESVGIPVTAEAEIGEAGTASADSEASDEDELVDVVESDSDEFDEDLLAPLRTELQRLHSSEERRETEPLSSSPRPQRRKPQTPTVAEYVRRGARLAEDPVSAPGIVEALNSIDLPPQEPKNAIPVVLWPEEDRMTIFLRILRSDIPQVRSLTPEWQVVVLSLRWIVKILHDRYQEHPTKAREKERWTEREARCLLAAFCKTLLPSDSEQVVPDRFELPHVKDRNIQLTAQIVETLERVQNLSQILLLALPHTAHLFAGTTLHAYLTGAKELAAVQIPSAVLAACLELGDLRECLAEEQQERKKAKKAVPSTAAAIRERQEYAVEGGVFRFLDTVEA